jgi:hypothetical protein
MEDARYCENCGTFFEPRREHARFCSAPCRIAWNREHTSSRVAEDSALGWSMIAMHDATRWLRKVTASNGLQGFVLISEAVWWVTIVDATLVRYHPESYDKVMADQDAAERCRAEATFAGLRFVRNRMGYHTDHADFIEPRLDVAEGLIGDWTWKPLPEPELDTLPPRGQAWEMTRYQAYRDELAGHRVGEAFWRAEAFLELASAAIPAEDGVPGEAAQPRLGSDDAGDARPGKPCHQSPLSSSFTAAIRASSRW